MKPKDIETLHRVIAILISAIALAVPYLILSEFRRFPYGTLLLSTTVWAMIDTKRLKFHDYRVTFHWGTIKIFFMFILFWYVFFPWFLWTWLDIQRGVAKKHGQPPNELSPLVKSLTARHIN